MNRKVVFIDDDSIMHMGWQMEARNHSVRLSCFKTVDEFLAVANEYPRNTEIFVDSNLAEGKKGEIESEKIYNLGFEEIYLATGYAPEDLEKPSWIKEIRGKKPNFG